MELKFSQDNSKIPTMWVKFQRLTRGSGRRKFLVVIWIAVMVISTFLIYKYQSSRQSKVTISNLRKRLLYYCNPPGPVLGNENDVPIEYSHFKLKQVQVVVRHGDRSSVASKFPTSNSPDFNCELKTKNDRDLQKIKHLKDMEKFFHKIRIRPGGKPVTEDFWLDEKVTCKSGQLTSKGYLQHLYLGEHMYNSYGRKLDISIASVEEEEMLAFATPVERTQQSAAAFLAGMLQTVFKTVQPSESFPSMNIHVSSDRLGTFREDENGIVQPCPRLHTIFQRSKKTRSFQSGLAAIEPLMQTFSHLFNVARNKLPPITWIGDLIVAHHCHNHLLVCGPNGCVDDKIKSKTLKACDWAFTSNYTPVATILSHSLLSKVIQRMVLKVSEAQHTKFVLFLTHDSVVIPVLESLGIFSNEWVPYATRVVFELWEAGGLVATKLKGNDMDKHFVRVLVNGKDHTRRVKMCKHSLKFTKLCPLTSFVRFLEGNTENMDEQYVKLCKMKQ